MIIVHDPQCADYGSSMRPEQPARITTSAAHLRTAHPEWQWRLPTPALDTDLLRAHHPAHLKRLAQPSDFDADTPFFHGIGEHARRAVGAALLSAEIARTTGQAVFSLMRPPGHHATSTDAMGFCYLNSIAIAALAELSITSVDDLPRRVAVGDFDAHHGNGTEAILRDRRDALFTSVHQYPGYPGTGTASLNNCLNWPVAPSIPRDKHLEALRKSWEAVVAFKPDIVLVSAGFDAYAYDPITSMTLEQEDFATLGTWLRESKSPVAAVLEGGYSNELPLLIDAFLSAWE
jgi:acetoin utilization deacetylase AcuC-like enzyme